MAPSGTDIVHIFTEDAGLGDFLPAFTFGLWFVTTDFEVLGFVTLFAVLVGSHRTLMRYRADTPDQYSRIGGVLSGVPLFLLYPAGLIVSCWFMLNPAKTTARELTGLFFVLINVAYLFGLLYIAYNGNPD
jgi:hypothetical protein